MASWLVREPIKGRTRKVWERLCSKLAEVPCNPAWCEAPELYFPKINAKTWLSSRVLRAALALDTVLALLI